MMDQSFRQTLKEMLHDTYQTSNESLGADLVHAGLGLILHNNANMQNHITDVQSKKQNEKNVMSSRMAETLHKIDLMKTKDIVKAISVLHEKGFMDAIKFIESVNVSK